MLLKLQDELRKAIPTPRGLMACRVQGEISRKIASGVRVLLRECSI